MSQPASASPAPGGTYYFGTKDVARIGYGAIQLRRFQGEPAKAEALLRRALALGVNHIDTAEFYGNGFANDVIQRVVGADGDVVVATKAGADPELGGKIPVKLAQRPEQLRATVEANLLSLKTERIPLVNLRRADVGPGLKAEGDQVVSVDEQMAEMIAMRSEGKIGSIGLSAVSLDTLTRALPAGIACVQNAYSLLSRDYEDLLTLCVEQGIAWVPFYPLGGNFEGWPKVTEHPQVIAIADRLDVTPSQVGLAWLLRHQANVLLIPGTGDIGHLEQNVASGGIVLSEEVMAELDGLATMRRAS